MNLYLMYLNFESYFLRFFILSINELRGNDHISDTTLIKIVLFLILMLDCF